MMENTNKDTSTENLDDASSNTIINEANDLNVALADVTNGRDNSCTTIYSSSQTATQKSCVNPTNSKTNDKENTEGIQHPKNRSAVDVSKLSGIKKKRASFFTKQFSSFDGSSHIERFQSAIASAASVFSSSVGTSHATTTSSCDNNSKSADHFPSNKSSEVDSKLSTSSNLCNELAQGNVSNDSSKTTEVISEDNRDNENVPNSVAALLSPSRGSKSKTDKKSKKNRKDSKKGKGFLKRSGSHSPSIRRSPTKTVTENGSSCINYSVSDRSGPSSGNTTPSPRSFRRSVDAQESAAENSSANKGFRRTANTLTVPSNASAYGAIPRTTITNQPQVNNQATENDQPKRCFCGHFTERPDKGSRKSGRCKFCRTKPKYLPNQRSLDAGRFFGRRRERAEPRRALSEDRRGQEEDCDAAQYSTLLSFEQSSSPSASQSTSSQPTSRHSIFSSRTSSVPFLRRQARLPDRQDLTFDQSNVSISPPILSNNLPTDRSSDRATSRSHRLTGINGSYSLDNPSTDITLTPPRDHGLLTPPGPPPVLMSSSPQFYSPNSRLHSPYPYHQESRSSRGFRNNDPPASLPIRPYLQRPTSLDRDNEVNISRHTGIPELQFNSVSFDGNTDERAPTSSVTSAQQALPCSTMHHILEEESTNSNEQQRMSHEMVEYLVPPSRYGVLSRAHTDPNSTSYPPRRTTPVSPPPAYGLPAYEEVVKEPRIAPPSYEEALSSRTVSLRLNPRSLSYEERGTDGAYPSPPPPFRPHRTTYAGDSSGNQGNNASGASNTYEACHASLTFTHSCPAQRQGSVTSESGANVTSRIGQRQLTRSSRAEEIPDIYWEQAARELDFCTCRKCQARYRQYFEEEPDPNMDAGMIPIETQVLMQEVLTDGMAFCSLM